MRRLSAAHVAVGVERLLADAFGERADPRYPFNQRFADATERAWRLSAPRMLHREASQGPALASEQNATLRVGRGEHLSWHV